MASLQGYSQTKGPVRVGYPFWACEGLRAPGSSGLQTAEWARGGSLLLRGPVWVRSYV